MLTNKVDSSDFPVGMVEEWRTFLRDVHPKLTPGRDVYPEVFATNLLFPLQRQRELARMMQLTREIAPVTVMEIGADKGGGLYHWAQCLSTVRNVIACEIRGTPYAAEFAKAFPLVQFVFELDSRAERTRTVVPCWVASIDVLFIDGDKSKFYEDYALYRPLMRNGGLVFVHDFRDYGPSTAWERIKVENPGKWGEILDVTDWLEAKDRPAATAHDSWLQHWKGASCGVGVVRV